MKRKRSDKNRFWITILVMIAIAIIGWVFFSSGNIDNSKSYKSPVIVESNDVSVSYSDSGLAYKQVSGSEFSGKDGEADRAIYFPNAKEVYYSGMKLLYREQWSNKEDYVILHIFLWDDQIIEIGH